MTNQTSAVCSLVRRAADWYEYAQLAAEVGIVVASIALLLVDRTRRTQMRERGGSPLPVRPTQAPDGSSG